MAVIEETTGTMVSLGVSDVNESVWESRAVSGASVRGAAEAVGANPATANAELRSATRVSVQASLIQAIERRNEGVWWTAQKVVRNETRREKFIFKRISQGVYRPNNMGPAPLF